MFVKTKGNQKMYMSEMLNAAQLDIMGTYRNFIRSELDNIIELKDSRDWQKELEYSEGLATMLIKKTKSFIEKLCQENEQFQDKRFLKQLITEGISIYLAKYFRKSSKYPDRSLARNFLSKELFTNSGYIQKLPTITSDAYLVNSFQAYKIYLSEIILERHPCPSYETVETLQDTWHNKLPKSPEIKVSLMTISSVYIVNSKQMLCSQELEKLIPAIAEHLIPYFIRFENDSTDRKMANGIRIQIIKNLKKLAEIDSNEIINKKSFKKKPVNKIPDLAEHAREFNSARSGRGLVTTKKFFSK